jgi:hypothetical protein
MSSWASTKYKTKNWSSYNDSLKQRGSLSIWFDPEMVWTPPPNGKRGRQQQFSDAAIQTCLTLKVLFGMLLRQTTEFVQSLLRLVGLDWTAPEFRTLCRRQRTLKVDLSASLKVLKSSLCKSECVTFKERAFLAMYCPDVAVSEAQVDNGTSTYHQIVDFHAAKGTDMPRNINRRPFIRRLSDLQSDFQPLLNEVDVRKRFTVSL